MASSLSHQDLAQRIYSVRGFQVMMDSDLSELYETKPKILNQTVRRNISRFPSDFMFQLTEEEYEHVVNKGEKFNKQYLRSQIVTLKDHSKIIELKGKFDSNPQNNRLRSQIVTLKNARGSHRKYLPLVFTEHGVVMLSSILNSPVANKVNETIVRAFVELRRQQVQEYETVNIQINQLKVELAEFLEARMEAQTQFLLQAINQYSKQKVEVRSTPEKMRSEHSLIHKISLAIKSIQLAVAKYFSITVQELVGFIRRKEVVFPRQIAMYLVRTQTSLSYKQIARHFGRDHTTVMHACRQIEKAIEANESLRNEILRIKSSVTN